MKKKLLFLFMPFVLFVVPTTQAGNVDVGINLNIGVPAIVIESPPEFLLIPSLGLHVSIGAPYDIFFVDGNYYHFNNNRWYRSNNYRGPWGHVDRRHLPNRILKHNYREMLNSRDREYQEYNKDREKHRDRYFRPDGKDERKDNRRGDTRGEKKGGHGHKDN